jgi:hypothetical protein
MPAGSPIVMPMRGFCPAAPLPVKSTSNQK